MIIKVCGMTRPEDVKFCDQCGIDLLGFIFHPQSPRNVSVDWAASQKPKRALKVGVFVHQDTQEIAAIADRAGLDLLQLHGSQTPQQCLALGPDRVIKALWPQRYEDMAALEADMEVYAPVCRALLFDSGLAGGGHGQQLDISRLEKLSPGWTWYLAGGLGPHNLMQVKDSGASGFDLNSGLESAPGIKDHGKIEQAYNLLRGNS
ncbi:phosphoribosylanthranilate isomerase [Desulfovibrionales bacterium]